MWWPDTSSTTTQPFLSVSPGVSSKDERWEGLREDDDNVEDESGDEADAEPVKSNPPPPRSVKKTGRTRGKSSQYRGKADLCLLYSR